MKKATYFFFALCVALFCALPLSAQIYTETMHRTYGVPNFTLAITNVNWAKLGGTAGEIRAGVDTVEVWQRGVQKYYRDNFATGYSLPSGNGFGQLVKDYVDLSGSPIEIIGGQEFTIKSKGYGDIQFWANAVAFVDWDGNGAFDDHDPNAYNLYGISQVNKIELSGVGKKVFAATWTFTAPDFTEERLVRVRIRYDEGVNEWVHTRKTAIADWATKSSTDGGIPECTQAQVTETLNQNFYSLMLHRFFPSAQCVRGSTVDITLKIVPNSHSGITPQPKETIVGAGNVGTGCATSTGTAIANEAGFQAFMSATEGDYYLTQDITLTSLPVSQSTFSGTFDGNGHTITLSTDAGVDFSILSKDECFYPYGRNDKEIGENLLGIDVTTPNYDMTNYPQRVIAGGFCGVLARGGVIKNVKVVYDANADYNNKAASQAPIFGLVAGINKGRIENVSVDIKSGKTVKLESVSTTTASTFGGITGVLYQGVVKHCAVNIDGTLSHGKSTCPDMQETLTSAFIGRLQAGIVSNVKFSGSGTMYAKSSAVANVRNYMGGIAGMTHTPQGEFCGDQSYAKQLQSWGYDNGTKGLDVNNVILSYSGAMNMQNGGNSSGYAYHCRGLLFAEAHDTITVPNLITQYAARPTIEANASDNATLSGTDIPLISRTFGKWNAIIPNGKSSVSSGTNNNPRIMGKLFLYKDGRLNASSGDKFTNVNVNNTKLDWAYEYDPATCTYFSTPYAVATNTTASAAGIANASANVSDLGGAVVKIDPQPATTPNPTWTWSNAATPTTPAVASPVCTGGVSQGVFVSHLTPACTSTQNNARTSGRRLNSVTISDGSKSVTVLGKAGNNTGSIQPSGSTQPIYVDKTDFVFETAPGATLNLSPDWTGSWMHAYVYIDYNNDGTFNQTTNPNGDNSGELVSYNFYSSTGGATGTNSVGSSMSENCGVTATNIPAWKLPTNLPEGIYRLRFKVDWKNLDPCGSSSIGTNGGCICDITLKVVNTVAVKPFYCAQPNFEYPGQNNGLDAPATAYLKNLTASTTSGTTKLAENWLHTQNQNTVGPVININAGQDLTLNFDFASLNASDFQWTTVFAFVDLNGDGDFSDTGERIYARGGKGWQNSAVGYGSLLTDGIDNNTPTGVSRTVSISSTATKSMLRIIMMNEWSSNSNVSTTNNYTLSQTGCATGSSWNGNTGANKFHCYDFPIQIFTGTPTCKYVHDFGEVGVGETATYTMPIGEAFTINTGLSGTNFTANKNGDNLELTYTPTATGDHTDKLVINYGGNNYDVELTGKGVNFPTLTFQIGEDGGGFISTDMGKTTKVEPITFTNYHGELLTAVPQGPCAIEGWYVDEGTGFVKQTDPVTGSDLITPDFTYTGAASNVIVEVRFKFEDFEGDFGDSRFTTNTNLPFYISSIKTDGGIVNVNAVQVFNDATVVGGSAHLNYLTDQRLQTLTKTLGAMSHNITVTVENADKIPANARLLCFIDYNYNGWFDFASSADGLASNLTANNELVYVGVPNGDASQTFTFTITNDDPVLIDKYGKTRMRFMVATYVDMYGLGPVNQYGNYQPRLDTDGDGVADAYLPLNDSNGSLYTPNNECRYENYINVADVNFEVVAYIKAEDTYTIEAGTSTRMGDLYIESVEDGNGIGIHSGKIIFDKGNPTGSLQVEGNIVVRRRIYDGRWHDMSFPIAMQGLKGDGSVYDKGICAVTSNGTLIPLEAGDLLLYTFDPTLRNQNNGYGQGPEPADAATGLTKNTFYEFAADVTTLGGKGADVTTDVKITPTPYCWIQFHSENTGFHITAKSALPVNIEYLRDEEAAQYWNRNVYTIYNPYLSPINVQEITTSPEVKWENITWWNASQNCFKPVSAAQDLEMPPYFGYWIQFTEGITGKDYTDNVTITVNLGNETNFAYPNERVTIKSTTGVASSFDTPDAYTLGIDRAAATLDKYAVSNTIVTLTDVGSVDEFRAGYDMPVSYAAATSTVPEIWSKAGSSRMMFNDVMRDNEVVVPVGIRIKEAGEYVIRLTHTNFAESLVQLYDKQTGARVDLQRNGELFSYNFLADAGDADSRFDLIIIAPESMTDLEVIEQDEVPTAAAIYKAGSTLRIVNMPLGYTVSVCDVIGREVLHTTVVDADMQLELPNSQGVYLVNVRNEKGAAVQVLKLAR